MNSLRSSACSALGAGNGFEARQLMEEAFRIDPTARFSEEWAPLINVADWPDPWLIAAVRNEPPDMAALDTLVQRYWGQLFGQCRLLTLKHDEANDLAQATWCRVLRARQRLKPEGSFRAYLATVAVNLWRDGHRSSRRAGTMADDQLLSLDAAILTDDGASSALIDRLPDLNALQKEEQRLLMLDMDHALEHLPPAWRDVLVARFITGESCASIAQRLGRTEQTISGWVRQAIRAMRQTLAKSCDTSSRTRKA